MTELEMIKGLATEQLKMSQIMLQAAECIHDLSDRVTFLEGQLALVEARQIRK